ncbi:ubiquinone biosynthesis protein COQ4 homolog, mitochondrial [Armigeres subalbatus]|uniref:ubiquinone biosynthesis protein COQ4 homolog, mitochondrial n=1 Tax=Armigeres subalbatus TaxID=124917 RepID=UPI002ED1BB7F
MLHRLTTRAIKMNRAFVYKLSTAENVDIAQYSTSTENTPPMDDFTREFMKNQVKLTDLQKIILTAGSSIAALVNPRRHDMIACLGETTGVPTLETIHHQMQNSEEGCQILAEKPRINTSTVDLEALKKLPQNTFGYHYATFLEKYDITPDSRMEVRFMENPELAYVMTRYREVHDLVHTVFGMPTNMLGEVTIKWVEAINIGLPMCYGGAVFGAFRLRPKQRRNYLQKYLPWALRMGQRARPMMCVYWEKRWEQDIDELRKELNIEALKID